MTSGFLTDGTLISASAVPHCGGIIIIIIVVVVAVAVVAVCMSFIRPVGTISTVFGHR